MMLAPSGPLTATTSPDCAKAGGSHEVVYDVTIRYLGGWLGEDPSSLVSFCMALDLEPGPATGTGALKLMESRMFWCRLVPTRILKTLSTSLSAAA